MASVKDGPPFPVSLSPHLGLWKTFEGFIKCRKALNGYSPSWRRHDNLSLIAAARTAAFTLLIAASAGKTHSLPLTEPFEKGNKRTLNRGNRKFEHSGVVVLSSRRVLRGSVHKVLFPHTSRGIQVEAYQNKSENLCRFLTKRNAPPR